MQIVDFSSSFSVVAIVLLCDSHTYPTNQITHPPPIHHASQFQGAGVYKESVLTTGDRRLQECSKGFGVFVVGFGVYHSLELRDDGVVSIDLKGHLLDSVFVFVRKITRGSACGESDVIQRRTRSTKEKAALVDRPIERSS